MLVITNRSGLLLELLTELIIMIIIIGGDHGCREHRLHSSRGGEGWIETVAAPGFDLGNKLFIIYSSLFIFNPREATL